MRFRDERDEMREAAAQMAECVHRNRAAFAGPGVDDQLPTVLAAAKIGADGRADLSRASTKRVEALYGWLTRLAEINGMHWRSGIDVDTGRMVVCMEGGTEEDHAQCGLDLAYGWNTMGLSEELAWAVPMLNCGGEVLLPCPDCARFGRDHMLAVRKDGDQYVVTPAGGS